MAANEEPSVNAERVVGGKELITAFSIAGILPL